MRIGIGGRAPYDEARDIELMQRLDALVDKEQLYRDADLTLARLAHRLSVPAKHLSAAINRTSDPLPTFRTLNVRPSHQVVSLIWFDYPR